ncbi:hypothetical protein DFR33_102242 [Bradymonas sediminis]|uniref:Endonuclease/exonuclease/phosphatase family protein n=1 Tax=Bradymonas sediminis TaxID=1548548 RepID=A0A2Z4FLF4_9DELT|nr:endonuclease/exonuclease/phosphatase family protein [Bradymonas sediminis]TDP76610.1 hypothetical protein DFR33_102242 [Bradymonas sediminis]
MMPGESLSEIPLIEQVRVINQRFRSCLSPLLLLCVFWFAACGSAPPDSDWRDPVDAWQSDDVGGEQDAVGSVVGDGWRSGPGAEAIVGPVITVATFNQHHLSDTICQSGQCGPNDFERKWSQAEFDARIAERAAAIDALNADIIFLQEVETQAVLDALNAALDDPYPVAILAETGYSASLDVAVLARGALVDSREYSELNDSTYRFSRRFLRVDLDIQGERVIAFSAHFKAKYQDQAGRRIAEAKTAHQIVTEVAANHDGALVILGGDLNDTPDSEPLMALTGDGLLKRVAEGMDILDVYTFVYQQRRQEIDHLLIAPTRGGRYVNESVHSLHDEGEWVGYGGSDHSALVGQFEMR